MTTRAGMPRLAQQCDEQPALGGAVAAAVPQALGGGDGGAVEARLVADLVLDEAVQRLGQVRFGV